MREDNIRVRLGEFAVYEKGKKPKNEKKFPDDKFYIPYVDIEAFEKGRIKSYTDGEGCKFCKSDDFLMVWDGARSGLVSKGVNGALGSTLMKINFPRINNDYILYFLQSKFIEINTRAKGTGTPHVDPDLLWNYYFPLVSIPEQRAIVAKIEELFSELDNGVANLNKAKEKLEIYRQAVLKKAFEGELTKEWRENHRDIISGKEMVNIYIDERERDFNEQLKLHKCKLEEWGKENSKTKPVAIKKPRYIDNEFSNENSIYGRLPNNWIWERMCNVTYKIGDVDHKMPKDCPGGVPYLSTGNLSADGTMDFENSKKISIEDFNKLSAKIKPEKGDILFPRYGTIGRNILVTTEQSFLVSYSCAIIKTISKYMVDKYLFYYSISPVIKKEIERYKVQTTQANVGISSIESFVIPICSQEEQIEIVKEIEARLSVCDNILTNINEGLTKADALRQSILKQAFEGNLLSKAEIETCKNETDWEPAEILLEKIKNELRSVK